MVPDTTDTAPNSPTARALVKITPYNSAQRIFGSVICQNTCQPLAPNSTAASSCSVPRVDISGTNSRTTKGQETNTVTITKPGQANISCMSYWFSNSAKGPLLPYNNRYNKPATTGDTAKGMSIRVSKNRRPGKLNRVTHQAIKVPNSRFIGTVKPATNKVRPMACSMSGSARFCQTPPIPAEKAAIKINSNGTTSNNRVRTTPVLISKGLSQRCALLSLILFIWGHR